MILDFQEISRCAISVYSNKCCPSMQDLVGHWMCKFVMGETKDGGGEGWMDTVGVYIP